MLLSKELLSQLELLQIPSRRRLRNLQRGEKASNRKGSSVEFSDYREYLQGDDIRSIDWSIYARTERLFLKLFLEEESKPVTIVVDASESMKFGEPSKFEYTMSLALALCYISLRRYDRPAVLVLRDQSFHKFGFGSQKTFFPIAKQLEALRPSGETHLSAALRKIALARFARGIYFILSDFYSYDGFDGMKLLAASGNEIHCLQVLTDEEVDPEFRGDLKLRDSETSDIAEVSISPQMLKKYMARLNSLQHQLKTTAHRSFASFNVLRTSVSLSTLILHELCSAGVVI